MLVIQKSLKNNIHNINTIPFKIVIEACSPNQYASFGTFCVHIGYCPLSKGNQAPYPKFERSNGKNTKSIFFLISQELVRTAHLKAQ